MADFEAKIPQYIQHGLDHGAGPGRLVLRIKKQQVDVTMAKAGWCSFLGPDKQIIAVESGNSQNAVFGFKAISAIKDAKQRVTAVAQTDSDAIEKPVTVRPNGQEIVRTDSRVSGGNAEFDVNFPANALLLEQE